MFKKVIVLALAMTLTLSTVRPQKAEAGAVLFAGGLITALVGAGGGGSGQQQGQGGVSTGRRVVGGIMSFVGLAAVAAGALNFIDSIAWWCGPTPWPVTLIVLDADGAVKKDAMTNYFANHYAFVDNLEALGNLSQVITNKALKQTPDSTGHIMVRLTRDEVQEAMASADLTDSQIDLIATEMK